MKQVTRLLAVFILVTFPLSLFANGIIQDNSDHATPLVHPAVKPVVVVHVSHQRIVQHPPMVRPAGFMFYPGSLRDNIERVATHYGWKQVVWDVPYDYNWVGKTIMQSASLQVLLRHVLEQYPLQAVFYQGNHVLVIGPRVLK